MSLDDLPVCFKNDITCLVRLNISIREFQAWWRKSCSLSEWKQYENDCRERNAVRIRIDMEIHRRDMQKSISSKIDELMDLYGTNDLSFINKMRELFPWIELKQVFYGE